ncbi:TonB-dependent receptor plug domain-containing protein [Pseudoblastomonas halimionae]|uniref:TonB-dependent receptor plug domain-containing protein n=1 Tax=Alteriqipengyuania halimionae TaxID=1926630 RepID=A0A6I4TYR0_9SPHN|nr:TonB-dependent receptor plug domain-containing protein [Alteriqipengyuania halimionae]MXP08949.1 TonB-dependent receptor plug domain-containing protein [Alteriqipengyuania halimionae]
MKCSATSLGAIALVLASSTPALAQAAQDAEEAEALPEAVAEGERVDDAYEIGTGNDSGVSTITRKEIEARTPGSGDVNQLLKILPSVQFDRNEGIADREAIQDLRPADISISGGRIYDNLVTIDGVDANSRLDISNDNPFNFNEVAGASAQTLWLDSELIGAITLRDSSVSAEYGRFTGGALDIQTREARRTFGASANVNYSSDALVNYIVSDGTRAAYEASGDPLPDAPEFRKWRFGVSLDAPIGDRGGLLVAANRSRADVLYFRSAGYDFEPGFRSSVSDSFLVSGNYDLAPDLVLSGQVSYSPYESEAANQNGIDNLITSKGGGLASNLRLTATGDVRWDIKASFAHNDTSRTAPPANYSIPSFSANGNVCSNTNCTQGGFGDLDQTQDTYGLTAKIGTDVGPGELRGGLDLQRIDVLRERPETAFAFSRALVEDADENPVPPSAIVCSEPDSLTCVTGEYALGQYSEYRAYTADIGIDSVGLWAEYDMSLGDVDLRAGVRYDYESFLGNHNVAPRLAATWNIAPGWEITGGANRYYGRSMLTYAIREQYPDNFIYRRTGTYVGGDYVVDDWNLYRTSVSTGYSDSDLDTPYSDELTAAVTAPLLGGKLRAKGIYRDGRDEFAKSLRRVEDYVLETGATATRRFYVMTNDGRSEYRGVSLEWMRTFGKHTIALNTNLSKTSSNTENYLETSFDVEEEGEFVFYGGEVVDLVALLNENQRLEYASPFFINASWTALWFDDRLTTNVNLRYRDGFEQIEDTGVNETVDGRRYDVYDIVLYPERINVDLNAQIDVLRSSFGTLTADIRASNLLDTIPARNSVQISQPYQYGRSFWFGLKFRY